MGSNRTTNESHFCLRAKTSGKEVRSHQVGYGEIFSPSPVFKSIVNLVLRSSVSAPLYLYRRLGESSTRRRVHKPLWRIGRMDAGTWPNKLVG